MSGKEIVSLTALRGIAAMAVIAMHFSATMQQVSRGSFPSLAPHGELAVDVFFVLSGFIMAYVYLPSFTPQSSWRAYWRFLWKRIARILPLNVFVVISATILALVTVSLFGVNLFPRVRIDHSVMDLLANCLMLPGFGIGWSVNWPAWSISVEFLAYLCFPLLVLCVFPENRYILVATCSVAVATIVLVCVTGQNLSPDGNHNQPFPWRDVLRCLSEFTLGIAVFRLYNSGKCQRFGSDAIALMIGLVIASVVLFGLPELLAVLCFPAAILALSLNSGIVAKLMSAPFPRFLGKISFSLYLVHDNFRPLAARLAIWLYHGPVPPFVGMGLAAVFTVAMILPAWATFVFVEKPSRVALNHISSNALVQKTIDGILRRA